MLKVMNSESNPGQISLAFCFAFIAGLTPTTSLHNLLILFLVLILRVNFSGFILAFGFFSGLSYALDPLFHFIGLKLLTSDFLNNFWTSLYNVAIWRLERFNNTIVLGSVIFSLVLLMPLYLVSNFTIRQYRQHILAWVKKTRIMQIVSGTKLYKLYHSLSELREKI